eukprot:2546105-Ditylum_brightwellii.AAC.1
MQQAVDLDVAYLMLPRAKSQFMDHFCLKSLLNSLNYNKAPNNAPIHTKCRAIKSVAHSTAEAEYSGIFHNGQTAIVICHILDARGIGIQAV